MRERPWRQTRAALTAGSVYTKEAFQNHSRKTITTGRWDEQSLPCHRSCSFSVQCVNLKWFISIWKSTGCSSSKTSTRTDAIRALVMSLEPYDTIVKLLKCYSALVGGAQYWICVLRLQFFQIWWGQLVPARVPSIVTRWKGNRRLSIVTGDHKESAAALDARKTPLFAHISLML